MKPNYAQKQEPFSRLICIGDIHGCLEELKELLLLANYNPKEGDRLIFVGDLIDRGPYSPEVVKYVRLLGAECVQGNHDEKLIRYHGHELKKNESLEREDKKPYKNPMRINSEKKKTYDALSKEDIEWLSALPNIIYIPELNTAVLHGGVMPGRNPLYQPGNVYRHCRYVFNESKELAYLDTFTFKKPQGTSLWSELYDGSINIVFGHNVESIEEPVIRKNNLGAQTFSIDTGCCFGGRLTALVVDNTGVNLENKNIVSYNYLQIHAKQPYYGR